MDDTNELISVWKSKQRINNIEENKEFFKSNKHRIVFKASSQ